MQLPRKSGNDKILPAFMKAKEQKYYGIHACLALWKARPQDLIRVYVHESNLKAFAPVLKGCASQKKAYHVVANEELNRITDSVHHEGVCFLAKEMPVIRFSALNQELEKEKICLLYLDGVQNPHNVGSILRTCAHFNIPYILGENLAPLTASACRIAKGGAERVRLVSLDQPLQNLERLKKRGFSFIATSSHGGASLYQTRFSPRTLFVFGSESHGLSKQMLKNCEKTVQIPGTGFVESLNVSVATSLCLGEYIRQYF